METVAGGSDQSVGVDGDIIGSGTDGGAGRVANGNTPGDGAEGGGADGGGAGGEEGRAPAGSRTSARGPRRRVVSSACLSSSSSLCGRWSAPSRRRVVVTCRVLVVIGRGHRQRRWYARLGVEGAPGSGRPRRHNQRWSASSACPEVVGLVGALGGFPASSERSEA